MTEITVKYDRDNETKTRTLEKQKECDDGTIECETIPAIGKRGKVRIRPDGRIFHHDPKYTLFRSVQIGDNAEIINTD